MIKMIMSLNKTNKTCSLSKRKRLNTFFIQNIGNIHEKINLQGKRTFDNTQKSALELLKQQKA